MQIKRCLAALMTCVLLTTTTACNKGKTEVVQEEIPELYFSYENVTAEQAIKNSGDLIVYTSYAFINKDKAAFEKVVKLENSIVDINNLWDLITENIKVPEGALVYDYTIEEGIATVTVAEKISDYYQKDAEGNDTDVYLGEVIGDTATIKFGYMQDGDNFYFNTSSLLDTTTTKIKVAEGATLKIGDVVINPDYINKDGYYEFSGFLYSDPLEILIDTKIMQDYPVSIPLTEITGYDSKNNPKYKTLKREFNPICYLDYNTKENARVMIETALQSVMTSLEKNQEIYKADCLTYFSELANLDAIALSWQTGIKAIHNTKDYKFTDLTLLSVECYSDEELKKNKESQNIVLTNDKAILTVKVKVSFNRHTYNSKGELRNSELDSRETKYVPVTFTIEDDGTYKIVDIGEEFFSGLVKKG